MISNGTSRINLLGFLAGSSTHTWKPIMTADTTTLSYWLNWRFSVCALFIFTSMIVAAIFIWKLEGWRRSEHREREANEEDPGVLYEDEAWNTCLKSIHPAWLLSFRLFAFIMLLALLLANVAIDGAGIFFYYTQWTFTLVTIYFGFGSGISIYGCQKHWRNVGGDRTGQLDFEQGSYIPPILGETASVSNDSKHVDIHQASYFPRRAGAWIYAFQILYQTCAGAVLLTDSVFWLILFPQLTSKDYYSLSFLIVCMHSTNAIFLLGDTMLNCMRFPFFRIAYFVLWTGTFVVFQWIIHASINLWWPYPFLDLSSSYAPLWYMGVGVMHIPSYGIFALIIKLKDFSLLSASPESFRKRA